ncbi:H(+)-transporting V0 sector ATPase subunit c [Tulasnella sp. 403]|nr:H(+)-transporting V0 sector ATPase subunit c [Tulasnella sp. 403]
MSDLCPVYAPFFSGMGCMSAMVFCAFGASYGTAKSSVGIAQTSILRPNDMVKNCIPVVMAGIIGIYGLVISVSISNSVKEIMPLYQSFMHLSAGLAVGLSGLAAGFAVGVIGDAGVRGTGQQPKLYVGMVLILIFAEVLGLYGLIVALIMTSRANQVSSSICGL